MYFVGIVHFANVHSKHYAIFETWTYLLVNNLFINLNRIDPSSFWVVGPSTPIPDALHTRFSVAKSDKIVCVPAVRFILYVVSKQNWRVSFPQNWIKTLNQTAMILETFHRKVSNLILLDLRTNNYSCTCWQGIETFTAHIMYQMHVVRLYIVFRTSV